MEAGQGLSDRECFDRYVQYVSILLLSKNCEFPVVEGGPFETTVDYFREGVQRIEKKLLQLRDMKCSQVSWEYVFVKS